jgi:hypothetical protein
MKKGFFMKLAVSIIIAQLIVYGWVHLFLSYRNGSEVAPQSTEAFFTVCTSELGITGLIKVAKEVTTNISRKKKKDIDE